jgi:threonine/homoserine/homoserine lactone efflux protein
VYDGTSPQSAGLDNRGVTLGAAVLSFALVAGLVTLTPGLDTALVLRAAVGQGRSRAYATALGVCAGCLVWGAAAAVGVSALLTASETAYTALRFTGAAYMLWLGAAMLRQAFRRHTPKEGEPAAEVSPTPTSTALAGFRRGLLTNLLNPKVGAFYVAMLPQFIPAHTSHLGVGVLLAGVHVVEGLAWFAVLITAAGTVRAWLARPSTQRAVDGVAGTAVIGLGLRLGLSSGH